MVFKLTIRLNEEMREKLRLLSKANNRSVNGQVLELVQNAISSSPKPILQNTIEKEEK